MINIAINGFGRIGRCILRAIYELNIEGVNVVAINGTSGTEPLAHLFEFDSVFGRFNGAVERTTESLIINGKTIAVISEKSPLNINWKNYGVDVVMECTGKFTSKEDAMMHIKAGAKKVIISAPAKEVDVKTIVMGVNHGILTNQDSVISIGSCTTNCLAPLAKALHTTVGIEKGIMTTIHSYTGDQNILDATHKDLRRGRAAALSMVPTSTGAAKAIGLVMPELAGKLDGSAIRVPTPNVSATDLCFIASKNTTKEEVNQILEEASKTYLKGILGFEKKPLVSIDYTHNNNSSIVDALETKVTGGNFVRVLSWYDNEWAFSVRMVEAAKFWFSL